MRKNTRRSAREGAVMALFEATFSANTIEEIMQTYQASDDVAIDAYGQSIVLNFYAHSSEVDELLQSKLKDWTLARLPRVNAAILRAAVTEMLYSTEDMDSIVINEAVEIAKKYTGKEDYQFINGVLGAISRSKENTEQ